MSKTTSVAGGAFPCPVKGCGRAFVSKPALTMHNNRVHRKIILVPNQKKKTREQILADKRAYNRRYRIRKGMKVRPAAQKEPKQNGAPWTPERRAKFEKTCRAKNMAKLNHKVKVEISDVFEKDHVEDPRGFFNHCPNCGHNLVAHFLAAGVSQRHVK